MEDQTLSTQGTQSSLQLPKKWQPKFIIKRIGDEDIEISLQTRNAILQALAQNMRYVQVGQYTLMLNSIKSIDPYWGATNIPPRPKPKHGSFLGIVDGNTTYEILNTKEMEEWDKHFGENYLKIESGR